MFPKNGSIEHADQHAYESTSSAGRREGEIPGD
jgi:hypothetical protein